MQNKCCQKKTRKEIVFGPIRVQLYLQALGQNNKQVNSKRMLGVVQLFLQRLYCIRKLHKHHVAGNAVSSNKIRQGHFLQEGQIFNTLVEISVLKFTPCFKQCYCLNLLLSTAFAARLHACRFPMHNSFCTKKGETQFLH